MTESRRPKYCSITSLCSPQVPGEAIARLPERAIIGSPGPIVPGSIPALQYPDIRGRTEEDSRDRGLRTDSHGQAGPRG